MQTEKRDILMRKSFTKKRSLSKSDSVDKRNHSRKKRERKSAYDPKEEARLERVVFGDPSDIINSLPDDDIAVKLSDDEKHQDSDKSEQSDVDVGHLSANRITIVDDRAVKRAAWLDEDDLECSVEDASKAQNRKTSLNTTAKLYTELLQNKYKQLVGTPKWAELNSKTSDHDDSDDDILKHSCHIEKPKQKNLPKNLIDIKALTALNKETHIEGPVISSIEFHPLSTVALVAGTAGILSIFQVDGIKNPKLHSIKYNKFPVTCAKFLREGTEILCGSRYYPHCHTYDLISGKTHKIPLPHGITNMEKFSVSPNGKFIAVCSRMGEIYLLSASTKELISTLKMNARCRALAFTPDSRTLISHGDSNEMYVWDLDGRACVHRAIDDGCLSCSSIAISSTGQFTATGSKEGVVNLYDTNSVLTDKQPIPVKVVLNLVTSITDLKFNPLSEILAIASNKKANAFKMLHLPSFTIFSNFPTFQTNMSMPEALNFSPGSGYLSISNRSGTAFLYRLKHYQSY